LLILQHGRRQILWLGVAAHPTVELISLQLTEAYVWKVAPRYIIRDRAAVYGDVHPPPSSDEHSGSANRAAIAVAERIL
jgi:hypothetical protein